jgi:hypothetical protein
MACPAGKIATCSTSGSCPRPGNGNYGRSGEWMSINIVLEDEVVT